MGPNLSAKSVGHNSVVLCDPTIRRKTLRTRSISLAVAGFQPMSSMARAIASLSLVPCSTSMAARAFNSMYGHALSRFWCCAGAPRRRFFRGDFRSTANGFFPLFQSGEYASSDLLLLIHLVLVQVMMPSPTAGLRGLKPEMLFRIVPDHR